MQLLEETTKYRMILVSMKYRQYVYTLYHTDSINVGMVFFKSRQWKSRIHPNLKWSSLFSSFCTLFN